MEPFLPTPSFAGPNRPARFEADVYDCEIFGTVPAVLNGALFRCGPDRQYPTLPGDNSINGDGMISAFYINDGHVDFKCRYVKTERLMTERTARRRLYGSYRNPYTDDPSTRGTDRDNTGNTTAFFHSGKLLALREDSWPYEIDAFSLETKERFNFDGALKAKTLTAHPKIDPVTGEWWSYSLFSRKEFRGEMALQVADADGNLVRQIEFEAPVAGLSHDCAVTREHVIFNINPLTVDLRRVEAGGDFYAYDPNTAMVWGVMPREGTADEIRWFRTPGYTIGHTMNAFTEGSKVHVDATFTAGNIFHFFKDVDGNPSPPAMSCTSRVTFDLAADSENGVIERFEGMPLGEMPQVDPRFRMSRYRYGFFCGPDGVVKVDWDMRSVEIHRIPNAYGGAGEPIFVPRAHDAAEGDGYLLSVVRRTDENLSELRIIDTSQMTAPPVAVVMLPFGQPEAFHGCFVPSSELQRQARR